MYLTEFKSLVTAIEHADRRSKRYAEFEADLEQLAQRLPSKEDMLEFDIDYKLSKGHVKRTKHWTLENDRLLLWYCTQNGYGEWNSVQRQMSHDNRLRFDYFFRSRTPAEINRRADHLLKVVREQMARDKQPQRVSISSRDDAATRKRKAQSDDVEDSQSEVKRLRPDVDEPPQLEMDE